MKVRAGAKPNGKVLEVELDDSDMARDVKDWETLPTAKRWKAMTDRADILLVEWMVRRNDISKEYAESRVREIQGLT